MKKVENINKNEIIISRTIDAPCDLVFRAWTEPDIAMQWWGPKDFTSPHCEIDLRVGGKYLNCMRSPEGKDYWSTGVYREIVPNKRLVMTDCFADEKGNVVSASYYGMSGDWPLELLVAVTCEEQEGRTKLTLKHSGIAGISSTDRDNMEQGWNESLDKLEACLERLQRAERKAA